MQQAIMGKYYNSVNDAYKVIGKNESILKLKNGCFIVKDGLLENVMSNKAIKKPPLLEKFGINKGKSYKEYLEEAENKGVKLSDKFYKK